MSVYSERKQKPAPHPDPLPSHQNGSGEGTASQEQVRFSRRTDDNSRGIEKQFPWHPTGSSMTPPESLCWFCLCSQPKHEHVAAAHLRQFPEIGVFLPRIRFQRLTRQGAAWTTEALFPGYLFARFDWRSRLRLVRYAPGVRGVVHFGERWPTIPEEIIEELRGAIGSNELRVITPTLGPGDAVQITSGSLRGLEAVVSHVLPGGQRVAVLMDFLGRQTAITVPAEMLVREGDGRAELR